MINKEIKKECKDEKIECPLSYHVQDAIMVVLVSHIT